jgi:Flp pilus assembly protein TadD
VLNDPAAWFDDLTHYLSDDEIREQAAAMEPTLLHGGSRVVAVLWIVLVSAVAGLVAGVTFTGAIRSSWLAFAAYLAVVAAILRYIKPVSDRVAGQTTSWVAMVSFFFVILLAVSAIVGGRIDAPWLAYTVGIGGGLLAGLVYGSLTPGNIRGEEAWTLTALPLGGLSAYAATGLYRAMLASSAPAWAEPYVASMAALAFMVPMAILYGVLSSPAQGLAKMATLYLHNDNFTAKAIEYLDRAIALSPRKADLHNLRGIAYSKLGDGERADADFLVVSELRPRAAESHMNRGVDFLRQGHIDRAIEALEIAKRVNPKLATVHSNLGTACQKKGDLDAAIAHYTRALELRKRYPVAYANRAYSYFLKGDHDRAIEDARRAIALDANLPMAHVNLGHALAARGDATDAARAFRQALGLEPDPAVAEETLEALEKLGVPAADDRDEDDA